MSTTHTIELVDFEDLLPLIPATDLGSATIDLSLVKAQVSTPFNVDAGPEITFVVGAGAELTMTAFNQARTEDPDRILAKVGTTTPAGELRPQLFLDQDHGWLKYRAEAHARASAAVDAGWFAASAGASGSIVTGDYRRHDRDDIALSAIKTDIEGGPRFAVSMQDVLALAVGDAVALQVGGTLTARVTISWSDVFTSQLGTLTRAVHSTVPIGIKTSVGAKVSAAVTIADQFVLAFSRVDERRWRVGLKKGDVKQVDFGVDVGATVEIENNDEIIRVLDGFISDLLGKPIADIEALLAKSSISEQDLETFADVFRRLGLGSIPTLADVKQAFGAFQTSVTNRLKAVLSEKISLSFAYEYRRVASDTTLLQATLTQEALEANHGELRRGSLTGLIQNVLRQATPEAGPIVVEQYLNERKVTTDKAWGLTLGIGKWKLSGRDRRTMAAIRRLTLDQGHEQRSYAGLAEYTGQVFGEKQTWHVEFVADTPQFSVGPVPRLSEYQLGMNLGWVETNRTFDAGDIDQAVDFAIIWAACGASDADAVKAMLAPLRDKKGVEWSAHVRVNDEALRAMVRVLVTGDRRQFAGPMAAAMNGRDAGLKGILNAERRRTLYEPIWAFYLSEVDTPDPSTVSNAAQNHLRNRAPDSEQAERLFRSIDPMVTAAGTCEKNPSTRSNVDDFLRGVRGLAEAIDRNDPDVMTIPQAYKSMVALWTQSHHVRALGVRLIDVARQANQLKGVERTLTVTFEGKSLTVSSNPPGTI